MTVIEVVRKYGLEQFDKAYVNQFGFPRNLIPLRELVDMVAIGVSINLNTNEATITIVE